MKRIMVVFIGFIVLGCIFPITRNLRGVIQSYDDFTLTGVIKESDAASINKLLSGDVSLFKEFGADSCLVAEYRRGEERYTVEAVSFFKQKGALGAYFVDDIPGSQPVELGYHARKSDTIIQFVKGYHIVTVSPSKRSNLAGAYELAQGLAKRIRGSTIKPDIYELLPQSSKVDQSELYFMGLKAFQKRFSSELAQALKVDKAIDGLAARYSTDEGIVDLIKIRFEGREQTLDAVNSYLKSRAKRPIILPRETLQYYTIIEPDRSEVYIGEYTDWLYMVIGSSPGGKAQPFFEYVIRGGK